MRNLMKTIVVALLNIEAALVIKKYKPFIIAVTGNVGKTSTKDAIFHFLSRELYIRKSEKSFNSEIGVPLTVLGCENAWNDPIGWMKNLLSGLELILFKEEYPKYLVLEIGADHPGDIKKLTHWLKPDIAVMTRIPDVPVHIEFFTSRGEMLEEKACLVKALKKGGTLILNADDRDIMKMKDRRPDAKVITFGINDEYADIRAEAVTPLYDTRSNTKYPVGMKFNLFASKVLLKEVSVNGFLGNQHVYPIVSALATSQAVGMDIPDALLGINDYKAPHGRMNVLDGMNKTVIIDDTYNSSPVAVDEALNILKEISTNGRKIVVLGDMLELGKFSTEEHKKVGKKVAEIADILVCVGIRSKGIIVGARDHKMPENKTFWFEDSVKAGEFLYKFLLKKDIVLVKGSQGVRMEKIVKEIMDKPEEAGEKLIRQDVEWGNR